MISVVIPALNEQDTVADVVALALRSPAQEVIVIDADSTDATAQRAADAGARVVNWRDAHPLPPQKGKGESLWRGVQVARGDVVVFLDADLSQVHPEIVSMLAQPFADPKVQLVKANYARPMADGTEGGRVTALLARPLLGLCVPELAHVRQPLGGEYAIRRDVALDLCFVSDYGVEVALLIDVARAFGPEAIVEVEAGVRTHRNRSLQELEHTATQVAAAILSRAGHPGISLEQREPARAIEPNE
ncbi:glucosyl-3-phosphoglycerate synthase [Corynebacterium pseudopelargi]|uniref:Glucosyl-3-phosphoglycerate synthase n=1 Tax=Corynebacterium pseudopelargi TaxID=2080757 RepID=A0A3G6IZQ9_9CORY|nr:glucosyl-3-phosphoglycerate synthase [Corynebacterium pseudopelargi]AZA09550.1 Glucosyl-3-phosphoglycerate synthase [Corynebacterium pseudopelargi]